MECSAIYSLSIIGWRPFHKVPDSFCLFREGRCIPCSGYQNRWPDRSGLWFPQLQLVAFFVQYMYKLTIIVAGYGIHNRYAGLS